MKIKQIANFMLASLAGFAINIFTLYILTEFFRIFYIISASIAFILSSTYSYTFNKNITFSSKQSSLIKFLSLNFVSLLANLALLAFFTEIAGVYYLLSQIISSIITFFINFFLAKRVIFNK